MMYLARSVARKALPAMARPSMFVARRGFAEAVPADKLRLSLALPHETIYENTDVVQVNIPSTAGDLGILADHVPTIQQLRPGLVEIIESGGKSTQYFVSGGFATVSEGSKIAVNVVEAFAPEDFSSEAVKSLTAEAQKNVNSSDEAVSTEAKIQLEVLESLAYYAPPRTTNPVVLSPLNRLVPAPPDSKAGAVAGATDLRPVAGVSSTFDNDCKDENDDEEGFDNQEEAEEKEEENSTKVRLELLSPVPGPCATVAASASAAAAAAAAATATAVAARLAFCPLSFCKLAERSVVVV